MAASVEQALEIRSRRHWRVMCNCCWKMN